MDGAHAGGDLVDASGQSTTRLHAFGAKWAAMAPERFDVETFDSASCSFLRAILRVGWLIISWPFARMRGKMGTMSAARKVS